MIFLLLQPLPAASLFPGCADQQQAFPQDCAPAVVADVIHLVREAVDAPHLPGPPEAAAHPVKETPTSSFVLGEKVIVPEGLPLMKTIGGSGQMIYVFLYHLCPLSYSFLSFLSVWHKNQLTCASLSKHFKYWDLYFFSLSFLSFLYNVPFEWLSF